MSRVGIIGTGHIAVSIARIMASKGYELHATEHKSWVSSALKVELGASISAAQDVIDASELIFLCLHPLIAADVLKPLTFHADQQIVSIMAAISENELATICAPVSGFVRTIPLRFLQTGGCPLAAFGNDRLLADLSEPQNPVMKIADETTLNAHFAICALVPGILDLMAQGPGGWPIRPVTQKGPNYIRPN